MGRVRVSIAGVLGIVAVAAFGLAAVRAASELWAAATFILLLALSLTAVLGMLFLRGTGRAAWTGFALWCCTPILLANLPWLDGKVRPFLFDWLVVLAEQIHPLPPFEPPIASPKPDTGDMARAQRTIERAFAKREAEVLTHQREVGAVAQTLALLGCVLFGCVGATIARRFATRAAAAGRGGAGEGEGPAEA